jgi:quinol monooxygenase YgiN
MIIRIVKMTFKEENINDFISAFESRRNQISSFDGCLGVELLQDVKKENIFFTYSTWKDEPHLEKYRQSELFNSTWAEVKKWFSHKAEAWSLEKL